VPVTPRGTPALPVKAITAAWRALHGDGWCTVRLDKVIKTVMQTGADMKIK
jgi:L-serine dehydratase